MSDDFHFLIFDFVLIIKHPLLVLKGIYHYWKYVSRGIKQMENDVLIDPLLVSRGIYHWTNMCFL